MLLAAAYAWPSVSYVYGRDLALFHYVGREILNGALLYRDAFDTKPPGIYLLHSLLIALSGGKIQAIRIAEIAAVLATGCLAALVVRRSRPRQPGELGLSALIASSFYYTMHDYWDTGQVEIWESLALLSAYCFIERGRALLRSALLGGLLVGLALLFKPTAATVALVLAVPLALRAYREAHELARGPRLLRSTRALALYGLGSTFVLGMFIAYYALQDALASLHDLWDYLQIYSSVWSDPNPRAKIRFYRRQVAPWAWGFMLSWAFAIASAGYRREREVVAGARFALMLLLAAFASVAVQQKYFHYHWGVTTPFMVLAGAYGIAALARPHVGYAWCATLLLVAVGFGKAPVWSRNRALTYRSYVMDLWIPRLQGRIGPMEFARSLTDDADYSWANQRIIARKIRELAKPGDRLHVRGFELGIYVLSGLSTPARVVTEILLDEDGVSEHFAHWKSAHEETLFRTLPRFFVTFEDREWDLDEIRKHGYEEVHRAGLFVLLEHTAGRAKPLGK